MRQNHPPKPVRLPFKVCLKGVFFTFELYDQRGREVFTLDEAIEAANDEYPGEWCEVFNGQEGVLAEELLEEPI